MDKDEQSVYSFHSRWFLFKGRARVVLLILIFVLVFDT